MEAINRAIDGAAGFRDMLSMIERKAAAVRPAGAIDPEVAAWNAKVERKRAEKQARKLAAKVKP